MKEATRVVLSSRRRRRPLSCGERVGGQHTNTRTLAGSQATTPTSRRQAYVDGWVGWVGGCQVAKGLNALPCPPCSCRLVTAPTHVFLSGSAASSEDLKPHQAQARAGERGVPWLMLQSECCCCQPPTRRPINVQCLPQENKHK